MTNTCLYREGDCWEETTLDEFSEACVAALVSFDPDDADGAEDLIVEHMAITGMTTITYFNSDGESINWIFPTSQFVC